MNKLSTAKCWTSKAQNEFIWIDHDQDLDQGPAIDKHHKEEKHMLQQTEVTRLLRNCIASGDHHWCFEMNTSSGWTDVEIDQWVQKAIEKSRNEESGRYGVTVDDAQYCSILLGRSASIVCSQEAQPLSTRKPRRATIDLSVSINVDWDRQQPETDWW